MQDPAKPGAFSTDMGRESCRDEMVFPCIYNVIIETKMIYWREDLADRTPAEHLEADWKWGSHPWSGV